MFLPEVHQSEMVTAPDSKDVYVKMRNVLILCAFLGILGTPKVYLDVNNEKSRREVYFVDVFTAIRAGDGCVVSGKKQPGRKGQMVKIRLQGTTNELKRMRRVIERNRSLLVVSTSEVFPNKGTKKYFRQYMDISFDPVKKEMAQ